MEENTLLGSKLGRQLLVRVLWVGTIAAVLVTLLQLGVDYRREVERAEGRLNDIEISGLQPLLTALWRLDRGHAATFLEGMTRLPDMAQVSLRTSEFPRIDLGKAPEGWVHPRVIPLIYKEGGRYEELGTLTLTLDMSRIVARVADRAIATLAVSIIVIAAIAGALLVVVRRQVTRPLTRMEGYFRELDLDLAADELTLADRSEKHRDEFDLLAESINRMLEKIRNSRDALRRSRDTLEQEVEERTRELNLERNLFVAGPSVAFRWRPNPLRPVHYVSPNVANLLGYPADAFAAEPMLFTDLIHLEDHGEVEERLSRAIHEGKRFLEQEYRVADREGRLHWLHDFTTIVRERDGSVSHLQGYVTDIGERKAMEEELKRARDEAEEASLAKSRFLASMSHEIRTPMNAVINLTRFALEGEMDDRRREFLEKAMGAGNHLLGVINDILDFSKIEAGKLELDESAFNLDRVLSTLADLFGVKAAEGEVELLFDLPPLLPHMLQGDRLRLSQVLANLIGNALKFTHSGEVVLSVREVGRSGSGLELSFAVSDTGQGMGPDQVQELFQPFRQVDGSFSRRVGGTGLGLAISRRLVEMMGGRFLPVTSELGKGSTFRFQMLFPVAKRLPEQVLEGWTAAPRSEAVLLVEGHPVARRIVAEMIEGVGRPVVAAADAAEALERIAEQDGGFVRCLLDWRLPGCAQVVSAIRRAAQHRGEPPTLAVLVSPDGKGMREQARESGVELIVDRPLRPLQLISILHGGHSQISLEGRRDAMVPSHEFEGGRVLVADDIDLNRQVIRQLLADAGIEGRVVNSGAEALAELERAPFDLVLMDVQMPGLDGLETTRRIRARFPKLPVVAMTAHVMRDERERCLEAGMNDHLGKPIDVADFYGVLRKWLPHREVDGVPARLEERKGIEEELAPCCIEAGIDCKASVGRIGGRWGLYASLLQEFLESYRGQAEEIRRGGAEGEARATAMRTVHTLKGLAGTIGGVRLEQVARELDLAYKQGSESVALKGECADALEAILKFIPRLIEEIRTRVPDNGGNLLSGLSD